VEVTNKLEDRIKRANKYIQEVGKLVPTVEDDEQNFRELASREERCFPQKWINNICS